MPLTPSVPTGVEDGSAGGTATVAAAPSAGTDPSSVYKMVAPAVGQVSVTVNGAVKRPRSMSVSALPTKPGTLLPLLAARGVGVVK